MAMGMILKPNIFDKYFLKQLKAQKKFFKGTNLEKYTAYNYSYNKENRAESERGYRIMGAIFILFDIVWFANTVN